MCGWLINELIHLLREIVSLRSSGHNYLANQEKFCLSWNLTFSLTYSQEPTLGPVLSHLISVHILTFFSLISILLSSSNHALLLNHYVPAVDMWIALSFTSWFYSCEIWSFFSLPVLLYWIGIQVRKMFLNVCKNEINLCWYHYSKWMPMCHSYDSFIICCFIHIKLVTAVILQKCKKLAIMVQ